MYHLQDFGSFYISGRDIALNYDNSQTYRHKVADVTLQHYHIEQAYVQFYIPEQKQQSIPVILTHGGGQTGSVWECTPDGRAGWLHFFLQRGFTVYVIDNVERGRSGWCPLPTVWDSNIELRSAEETWELFRIGELRHFTQRIPFAIQQFPVAYFEKLLCYNVPRWRSHNQLATNTLNTLLQKLGRAHLVTHSQSGHFGLSCLLESHRHIETLVLMEPATFPETIHLTEHIDSKVVFIYGDNFQAHDFWKETHLKGVECHEQFLNHHINSINLELTELNLFGNSHMMMMDKNNEAVFEQLLAVL